MDFEKDAQATLEYLENSVSWGAYELVLVGMLKAYIEDEGDEMKWEDVVALRVAMNVIKRRILPN